jgi:putative FmdB family regulatory protein
VGEFFPGGVKALPLYPYRCTQCGYRFEKIQSFSSALEVECPKCKGLLERLLTVPGLQFKGTGWYVNDYVARDSTIAKDSHELETKAPAAANSGDAAPVAAGTKTKKESKAAAGKASESNAADSSAKSGKTA